MNMQTPPPTTVKNQSSRQYRRAASEYEIINACTTRMAEKRYDEEQLCLAAEKRIRNLENEALCLADAGESEIKIQRILDELAQEKCSYELSKGLCQIFAAVHASLTDLSVYATAVMKLEWYSYLVRTIPEKRLPKMIKSENADKMKKIIDRTAAIVERIEDRIVRSCKDRAQAEVRIKQIKDTARKQKELYEKQYYTAESVIKEVEQAESGKSATMLEIERLRKARGVNATPTAPTMPVGVNVVSNEQNNQINS